MPITIEKDFSDSPGYGYIPDGEKLYSGWNSEGENAREVYDIHYKEGVFVGYRWYENKKIRPLLPFGYGLSYTDFSYSNLRLDKKEFSSNERVALTFKITNTGSRDGSEIAQIYIKDDESSVERPLKELKAHTKVFLKSGEKKSIDIVLDKSDFSFWDETEEGWKLEAGSFTIMIGSSSVDIHLSERISISK